MIVAAIASDGLNTEMLKIKQVASYHTVLYRRDHKGVGVAHEITSPKIQLQFSLMTMRQVKLSPNKLSDRTKTLSTSCYRILKIIYLMEFSTD